MMDFLKIDLYKTITLSKWIYKELEIYIHSLDQWYGSWTKSSRMQGWTKEYVADEKTKLNQYMTKVWASQYCEIYPGSSRCLNGTHLFQT